MRQLPGAWARGGRGPTALAKLPGIGEVIAFAQWAEIGEVARFARVKYLLSYASLAPVVSDSDTHQGRAICLRNPYPCPRWGHRLG